MPIQQFTSCFYVIPMEHKFFTESCKLIDGKNLSDKQTGELADFKSGKTDF